MLKIGGKVIKKAILHFFNSIQASCFYPTIWKKSDEKNDPNNFRGIAISSCFGKLFTKLLKNRLEYFCESKNIINKAQGSGKKLSRTSDHLMVIKYFIDKIVKNQKKKLYACFVDIKKGI